MRLVRGIFLCAVALAAGGCWLNHVPVTYYVDNSNGSDSNPGTAASPFKTITHASSVALLKDVIDVAPGTYDAAHGETFPIMVPAAVTLSGDTATMGSTTIISGSGVVTSTLGAAVILGASAVLQGITVAGSVANGTITSPSAVYIASDNVVVQYCTIYGQTPAFANNLDIGVYFASGSHHAILQNNVIRNETWGILFFAGGTQSVVQENTITANTFGVEYDYSGGDLGGGTQGSLGLNHITGNTSCGLKTTVAVLVYANNNYWDHSPPTQGTSGAYDIVNPGSIATIIVTSWK